MAPNANSKRLLFISKNFSRHTYIIFQLCIISIQYQDKKKLVSNSLKYYVLTESHTHNGNYYDFSVNDLKYHLEDEKNTTYYGRVPLDAEDSQRIKLLIYNYLNTKYDILKSQLNALYNSETISEDKYNKILDEIETIKRYIKQVFLGQVTIRYLKTIGVIVFHLVKMQKLANMNTSLRLALNVNQTLNIKLR